MDARYYRPASPRYRIAHPARASTGTFSDPYSDPAYYTRHQTSPRTSGERLAVPPPTTSHPHYTYTTPSSSSGSRTSNLKYDSYSGRPRRNTLNESDDRLVRPHGRDPVPPPVAIPIRAPAGHHHLHHPHVDNYLSRSFDGGRETRVSQPQAGASRREHKLIYSVDDNSRQAELIADREIVEPHRREDHDSRGHRVSSGDKYYHYNKPSGRPVDLNDDAYSYTDAAGMYRDTEPVWRRPRSGSVERSARPTSMTLDRGPRTSNRDLGPPPSTRGFDRINAAMHRDIPPRSSSIDRSRDAPKYAPYPEAELGRSSSLRHKAPPAIHQEPRDRRRAAYDDEYSRREKEPEDRRSTAERFEDRDVVTRGFGIAPGLLPHHAPPADRAVPAYPPQEIPRSRPDDYGTQYYSPDRAEARMPEPRISEARSSKDRDFVPAYDERSRERDRERDRDRRDRDFEDRPPIPVSGPAAAAVGAAAGAAVTYGASEVIKSRDHDRDRDADRERERRREWDEKDRRDKVDDRRERRGAEERRERPPEDRSDRSLAAAAYASTQDDDRRTRDRRYEDEDGSRKVRERRYEEEARDREKDRKSRHGTSSDNSSDDRPRHYADREAERRREPVPSEPLDPDEEYRRRIQLEAERNARAGRSTLDGRDSDSDREKERRRRREEREREREQREREREQAARSRGSPSAVDEPSRARHDDRSLSLLNTNLVHEPESIESASGDHEKPSRSVTIVAPPKEPHPQPKGILRKPTEKFPEHPDPIREGVAPHKSALKGKDIPTDARWTKIDRRLVNPEALEEAKERFEERMDCVIVLRVLTKSEIQKLADRTKEIRETREEEYEREARRDRESRSHRSHRDEEDRGRYRDYDDDAEDDIGRRDRDRDRDRERPRMLEAGSRRNGKEKGTSQDERHEREQRSERHEQRRAQRHSDESSDRQRRPARRQVNFDTRSDATSDDENLPKLKQQSKLKDRINRVLNWL